ncbi:MAG: hypothetical protein Q9M91_08785 [Candidatus Dojkabacteria bacterium]|nr:hypothetical protein [Candidatus Dojkabacteria bacterium]MDQ7021868.1 hypothetical protein [Candidatus Dojkabacteria bacterium]
MNKIDLKKEINLIDFEENKNFKKSLRKKFIKNATPTESNIFSKILLSRLILIPLLSLVIIFTAILISISTDKDNINLIETSYADMSQASFMPLYYIEKFDEYSQSNLHHQMNLARLPLNYNEKDSFNLESVIEIEKEEAFLDCPEALPISDFINKITVVEKYKKGSPKDYSFSMKVDSSNVDDKISYEYKDGTLIYKNNETEEKVEDESLNLLTTEKPSEDFLGKDEFIKMLRCNGEESEINYKFEEKDSETLLTAKRRDKTLFTIKTIQKSI